MCVKRILLVFTALMITFISPFSAVFAGTGFNDVKEDHWAFKEIMFLVDKGYFAGIQHDGSFRPHAEVTEKEAALVLSYLTKTNPTTTPTNKPITRAELSSYFVDMFKLTGAFDGTFTDVRVDHKNYSAIQTIAGNKIAIGSKGRFKPDQIATRAEFAVMLTRVLNQALSKPTFITITLNGVTVESVANHKMPTGELYVDLAQYAKLIDFDFTVDTEAKLATVNDHNFAIHVMKEKVTVNLHDLTEVTGATMVTWDDKLQEAYVLQLPEGVIQITPSIPGMGEHWANPRHLPVGPIFGVEKGKLIFYELMISQDDFVNGIDHVEIGGFEGLPSPSIDHTDVEFQAHGHEGFEVPHFDLHSYYVTHEEHLDYGAQPELSANEKKVQVLKEKVAKYNDINKAIEDGYITSGPYVLNMGYHYINPAATTLDMPNILLYIKENDEFKLVGVEYGTPFPNTPSPFEGIEFTLSHKAAAHYKDGSEYEVASRDDAPETHPNTGAEFVEWHPDIYGIHVWFIENPDGTFAEFNTNLESTTSSSHKH